ncbi:MAG: hypothetical protein KA259_04830 [Caldilineaceae bacterium]|nr:hypothetical protein [Caldilineaceae bacterium]
MDFLRVNLFGKRSGHCRLICRIYIAYGSPPGFAAVILGADFGAYRGGTIRYAVPKVSS